jgi:hypothetical protein
MTFILPGGLGQLGAQSGLAWDPTMTGWGSPPSGPGLLVEIPSATVGGELGMPGGQSIAPLVAPTSITENFPTVENPLSSGGQWLNRTTYWAKMAVINGPPHVCIGLQTGTAVPPYNDAYAYLSPLVWQPSHSDYTVAGTVNLALGPSGTTDEWEVVLRVNDSALPSGTGTVTLYECNYQQYGAYCQIVSWSGTPGGYNAMASVGPLAGLVTGDVLSATIQGNAITVKRNGTTRASYTINPGVDPVYATGQPGFAKYYEGSGGDNFGFTQVVVTSAPYTAPTPSALSANVSSLATAGTIVSQIPCQHNPTSWSIVPGSASPAGTESYWSIDSFANVVVQAAAVGNIVASTYQFTATATNSFGSNTASVTLTNVGVTGPQFSNGNRTVIDGDNSHNYALAVRAKKPILVTGTTASRRKYFEVQIGNVGEHPNSLARCSAGVVNATWNPVTTNGLPLGYDTTGNSVGLVATASSGYQLVFQATFLMSLPIAPVGGDIIGIAVDTTGVNNPGTTALWFNLNGNWLNHGAGSTTTFPGLANPDYTTTLQQVWPACTTDYVDHVTIHPNPTPLYTPPGFQTL